METAISVRIVSRSLVDHEESNGRSVGPRCGGGLFRAGQLSGNGVLAVRQPVRAVPEAGRSLCEQVCGEVQDCLQDGLGREEVPEGLSEAVLQEGLAPVWAAVRSHILVMAA